MKRFSEQFKKQADTIRLKPSERVDLRARVTAYMEYHPLPAAMRDVKAQPAVSTGLMSQPYISLPINWFYVRGAASAFAVFMMVVVPVAAEYTKPGDILYPVKVSFNEEVRSGLTLNPYEKIEWETERLERRISEARLLANEGKLTDAVEAEVAVAVKAHSDSAKAQIAALRETDRDEAAIAEIAFATALSVQSDVLDKTIAMAKGETDPLAMGKQAGGAESSVLATVMAEETSQAEASQAASVPSFPKLMARVEVETTSAFELFSSVKNQASPEEVVDIERRLEDIKRKVAVATQPHDAVSADPIEAAPTETEDAAATLSMRSATMSDDAATMTMMAAPEATATDTEAIVEEVVAEVPEAVVEPVAETPEALTEAEAVELLRGVMADLRKLISFMTDIDVRNSISVEELVPMTLTPEEHKLAVENALQTIRNFTATYADQTFVGTGSDKLNAGVAEVVRLQVEVEVALETQGIEVAEGNSNQALALIKDLELMMVNFAATTTPSEIPPTETTE